MADKKLSELTSATSLSANDLLLVVSGGANKKITAGVLSSNLPSVGNKGITKNLGVNVADTDIVLTNTLYTLTLPAHTLGPGVSGQEITLIGSNDTVVTLTGAGTLTNITFPAVGSTCTLVYLNDAWYVKSHFSVTFG